MQLAACCCPVGRGAAAIRQQQEGSLACGAVARLLLGHQAARSPHSAQKRLAPACTSAPVSRAHSFLMWAHSHLVWPVAFTAFASARIATCRRCLPTCTRPCACPAGATQQAVWTCVLLNTLTLAMTCSTYYQLCGNGGVREGLQDSSFFHQAVCAHWLSPIPTTEYPNFSGWMLYGDTADDAVHRKAAAAAARTAAPSPRGSGSSSSIFNASFWFGSPAPPPPPVEEAFGLGPFNASQIAELVSPVNGPDSNGSVISPVFTMWITLVALYIGAQGWLC